MARSWSSFLPSNPIVKGGRQVAALLRPPIIRPGPGNVADSRVANTPLTGYYSTHSVYNEGGPKTNIA
jgi:hypothetical protein